MLDDQLLACQNFLQVFLSNVNPDDQLPVKVSSTSICKVEVNGAVTDWIIQYLHQWSCPDFLITPLAKIILDEVRFALNEENCPFFKADVNAYISFPLMQFVVRKVQDVCAQYKDPEKLRTVPLSDCILPTTTFATKNKRRQMEDRHVIINDVAKLFNKQNCQPVSYYAVFDGHNGIGAANYSATHLHQFLTESQFFPMFPEQALTDAFKLTDKNLLEKLDSQMTRSGTTAVVALLFHEDRMLYVAWVGDSEALISSKGRVQRLVEPHKADRPDEIERIKKCGGTVLYWQTTYRVNGQLAVSRSIGDADHKLCVISVPDIVSIQLEGDEDFIILACDGLWDCVEPEKAAKLVYDHVSSNPDKYEQTSQLLVEYAKEQGSGDNITTIVVFLTHPRNIKCCDIDMETATAESFSSNQNGATSYRPINNFDHDVDEDFGPETNVDNIDDLMSQPVPTKKSFLDSDTIKTSFAEQLQNDVLDHHVDAESKNGALEEPVKEIIDNGKAVLDEESEEEEEDDEGWDYFKAGSNSKPTNLSQQKLESSGDLSNEMEHTLNPEAREFVPVSPTNENAGNSRSSSPEPDVLYPLKNAQELLKEEFIASSPMKGQEKNMDDVIVPSLDDFANEIKKRPSNILPRFVDTDDFSTNDVANHELNNGNAFEESFGQDSTYTSTRAVFGDESTFAKNLDDVNEELIEKQVKSDVTSALNGDDYESGTNGPVADSTTADNHDQPEQNHSDDFISGDVSAGDAFESEDFPSIVEKEQSSPIKENHHSFDAAGDIFENGTSNVTYGRDSGKYDAENEVPKFDELLMSSTEKSSSAAEHADVFGGLSFNKDPLDEVIYKMSNFDCAAADDRSWLTGDSSHNVSSPTHDLLNGTNPFAAANAHSNEEKENAEEKDISQPAATTKYDAFDTLAAASNDHVDFQSNVSRDPFQSVFGDDGVPAVAEKQPVEETITAEKVPETQAGIAVEDAQLAASATPTPNNDISAQILDTREYADQLHESEDTEIVPTTSENQVPAGGAETPVGSVDMETPYIHDCTRLGHKHDSVHEPVQKRHYDDLLPDEEDQDATKESDKLESELRESTGGKTLEFDLGFGGSNAASCNRTFGDNTGDEFQSLMCNLVTSKTTPAADASDDSKPSVPASISDNELTTSTYEQPADGGLVTPPPTAAASADPEVHVSIAEAVDKLAASRIQDDEKPAADSDTSIAAAAIAAGATAVGVAAVTAAVAAKKPEPPKKQSVIKKPEGAKPAPSKSTAQKTAAPKPTTSAAPKPAARTSLGSTATKKPALSATPTKSTVTSSRPTSATAPKPSTPTARTSLTASKSNSTTTASKPSPRPAAAKPLASPSKSARPLVGSLTSPRTAAAKPITNGDVTSSSATRTSTSTTRRVLPVTGAARKITSPTSSAPTKPAVNLATRTSLAPKPKTTTTTTTNTTTGTSADKKPIAKRPLSSISSRTTTINKDSKDSTNKRLSRPATASSVTKTLPKTESKVNTGFVKTNANAKKVSSADQTSNQIDSTKMNGNA